MINRENFLASGKNPPAAIALAPIIDKRVGYLFISDIRDYLPELIDF